MNNNKYIKAFLLCTILSLSSAMVKAQIASSLYFLETIPQSNMLNPAMTPRTNVFIGLPGANSIYTSIHTEASQSNILQSKNGIGVLPGNDAYDYGQLNNNIKGNSLTFQNDLSIAPIYFGFRTGKAYLSFSWSEKISSRTDIAKDLINLGDRGFPDGSQFDLSSMGQNTYYYREFSLGYARDITSKLKVGAHIKPLFGLAAAELRVDKFDLNTSLEEWSADVDATVYTSAPIVETIELDENGYPNGVETKDFEASDATTYALNFSNPGIAFDLGAVYELNEAWSFSAALNNLGFISWKDGLNSVNVKGKHSWDGLSTNYDDYAKNANADKDYEHGDYIDDLFEELADTLMKKIPAKIGNEAFTTTLAPIAYLGAFYDVNHYFGVGALSRSTFYTDGFRQDFRFSANLNLYHVLTTTVNYNWTINGSNDLGFGIALRGGPFQFYFMLDHIPVTYDEIIIDGDTYPSPRKFDTVTFMTGINFLFGPNGYKDKPMVDSYSEY